MPFFSLESTFGALLIGTFFSAALFGVTCTQVFFYFQTYESDDLLVKASVVALLILEGAHSALSAHAMYYYVIMNYLNPSALIKATWSATMTIGLSVAIVTIVHVFYIRRVYIISRKNVPLVVIISLLVLALITTGIAVTIRAFQLEFFTAFVAITPLVQASLAVAVATDVLIAAALSYYLHTSRSGVKDTDTVINRLMMYTINNGILTSVFDIVVIACVRNELDNLVYLAVYQIVGNLYTNSMLATLNSRQSLRHANPLGMHVFHVTPAAQSVTSPAFASAPGSGYTTQASAAGLLVIGHTPCATTGTQVDTKSGEPFEDSDGRYMNVQEIQKTVAGQAF